MDIQQDEIEARPVGLAESNAAIAGELPGGQRYARLIDGADERDAYARKR